MKVRKCRIGPARCAVDLGDGSERAAYVPQEYILTRLGRPHRAVNIMFCYYPFDREWPARISEVMDAEDRTNAWGYSYDDYVPLSGEEPFREIEDIRRHGEDVIFTLTCDPAVTDEMIRKICLSLRPYGRIMLRLNHEANGNWFSFNKRCGYEEVARFFVRFHRILRETAPNVRLILCLGAVASEDTEEIPEEKAFIPAIRDADIWSADEYLSLNWGWPNEVAETWNSLHKSLSAETVFRRIERTYRRFEKISGGETRPMLISEFNDDGDVLGPAGQVRQVRDFYRLIEKEGGWLRGITMYQFRDAGRLGLERTDENDERVGIAQPLMAAYREIIHRAYFSPRIVEGGGTRMPARLRWGGSEDAEGLSVEIHFEGNPVFAEAYFTGGLREKNLMLELNGRWFYKAPGTEYVDFLPAFWERPLQGPADLALHLFAPPADGKNHEDGRADWDINTETEIGSLPEIRVRYTGAV